MQLPHSLIRRAGQPDFKWQQSISRGAVKGRDTSVCLTLKLKTRVGAQAEGDKIEWTEKKNLSYVLLLLNAVTLWLERKQKNFICC